MMFFEYPDILYLEFLLIPLALLYIWREMKGASPALIVSDSAPWTASRSGRISKWLRHVPFVLRMAALSLIIVAIARPRSSSNFESTDAEGIDIFLALDISTSMLARDFTPDRINASKDIAIEFIAQRPSDRIGVVVFAGESYTQAPLTTDRATLINLIKEIEVGLIEDGTAIGNGLATAVSRMKDSDAKSRVVILLTDGSNNMGDISPLTAANIAKSFGIRVYTIAIGSKAMAPYPMQVGGTTQYVNLRADVDVETLGEIASTAGGHFYRATNTAELKKIYEDIDKLEKTKMDVKKFSKRYDAYQPFALAAFVSMLLEVLLRLVVFRRIP